MNSKYIFLDLDGTTLNDERNVCDANVEAINKALSLGHHIIIATGRPLISAITGAKKIGLYKEGCYILCYNGGMIFDCTKEEIIYKQTLTMEQIEYLFNEARKVNIHIQSYKDNKVLCEKENEEVKFYVSHCQMEYKIVDDVLKELESPSLKVLLISFNHKELVDFKNNHSDYQKDSLYSMFSCEEYLEYMPYGISKGSGIIKMCNLLNIDIDDTIAMGDERNDLSMIETAHIGVAMKNAVKDVKDIADYITENDNNNGGVAEAIYKFVIN